MHPRAALPCIRPISTKREAILWGNTGSSMPYMQRSPCCGAAKVVSLDLERNPSVDNSRLIATAQSSHAFSFSALRNNYIPHIR
jgi:hypothetical protein